MEHSDFEPAPLPRYPIGKREGTYGILTAIAAMGLWNSILYGGFNFGFACFSLVLLGIHVWYLRSSGHRFGRYETSLLVLSAVLLAGFARSSDGVIKAAALLAALFAVNLSFCLAGGQNRRSSGSFPTVWDSFRCFFVLGVGGLGSALRGLDDARKQAGSAEKKGSAALLGMVITIPVLAVMLPLLIRSDAAFEGLMNLLPEIDWAEPFLSLTFGLFAAWVLFARGLGLKNRKKPAAAGELSRRLNPITVNILLGTVSVMYLAYLFSQLAYFSGGLLGLLPEGYTLAEYARRGFFEMAWLSGVNLGLILVCSALVQHRENLPAFTRILCLFLGAVTLFLVGSASAKMLLYIRSYGLTRLRILTQTVMVWLAITVVLVCIRLFRLRFPYMKGVILTALALTGLLMWMDVDSVVARYNVRAWQQGRLETVDLSHLSDLGYGAVPYIAELSEETDPEIAPEARAILYYRDISAPGLRSWNFSRAMAAQCLTRHPELTALRTIGRQLNLDLGRAILEEYRDIRGGFQEDGEIFARITLPENSASFAETMMEYGDHWQKLPLREDLSLALYGGMDGDIHRYPLFTGDDGTSLLPQLIRGWYFLADTQDNLYPEESLFSQGSFPFCAAVYDADTRTLYYFDLNA